MRLFHSATIFLLLHMYMYLLFETSPGGLPGWSVFFFNSIWWGALSSNVFTICALYWSLGCWGYFGVSNVVLVFSCLCDGRLGIAYANMLVTTQWLLKRAAHLTSLVWVCVLWRPWKLNGAICAMHEVGDEVPLRLLWHHCNVVQKRPKNQHFFYFISHLNMGEVCCTII